MRTIFSTLSLLALVGCGGDSGTATETPAGTTAPGATDAAPGAAALSDEEAGEAVATVGGMAISSREFQQAAARRQAPSGESEAADGKQEVLDRLVAEKLLYLKAVELGLDRDPKVQKVMINTLLRDQVYSTVKNADFPETELQDYYDSHKEDFVIPAKVQVKRVLIRVTPDRDDAAAKAEAQRLRGEVSGDLESFRDIASENSEGPYKRRGGDIGFVAKEGKPGLDPAIVEQAFNLKVDTLSQVFKTREGYNFITVAKRRDRVERSFQQVKGAVLRKLKNEKLKNLYDSYVDGLRDGADVQVNDGVLESLDLAPSIRGAHPMLEGMEGAMPGMPKAPSPRLELKRPPTAGDK
jgi:parvulin-like peptidyl-prolyl isomerase